MAIASSSLKNDHKTMRKRQITIGGRWATRNSVAGLPAAIAHNGKGFTVQKTAAGTYVVTFTDWPVDYLTFLAKLQLAAIGPGEAKIGPISAAAKTVTVYTVDAAGAALDPADNANSQVFFSGEVTDSPDANQ